MDELVYRKALPNDIKQIADLVTNLLGTCNLNESKSVIDNNIDEISNTIDKYFVCEVNGKVVGAGGISDLIEKDSYNLGLENIREILYLVVDENYQGCGIGTKLLNVCITNQDVPIIYEAWGDGENVNSKTILEKCGFRLCQNLGNNYYKNNNYCDLCVNRSKECNSCHAQIWIKDK